MNKYKIPVSKTYPPLNLHSNFNLDYIPARGTSWREPIIKKRFPKKMRNLKFPITNEISFNKAFQLNIPPYLKDIHINYLVKKIKDYVKIYKR